MATKLWQTDVSGGLNPLIERYTVGNDYQLDQQLVGYDIAASRAHVEMLHDVGLLNAIEFKQLSSALDGLLVEWDNGKFTVQQDQEDCHTAIEQYLVEKLGDAGKKIHAGRSRNDQSLVMMRLYLKDHLHQVLALNAGVAEAFKKASIQVGPVPMPGYTHMQKAMPTTVELWLDSYAVGFADMQQLIESTLGLIDQNPLGSAAGFGVPLLIDRGLTTKILGFKKTQENPMYCGLSRGLFELLAVQTLNPLMVLAGKFAHDMLLFTTQEFGFFSLPSNFTTGSSIMPHKQNYDLFEIMRGYAHMFGAHALQLHSLSSGIGSGYQRDLQLSKSLTLKAFSEVTTTLEVLSLVVPALQLHPNTMSAAITDEMQSVAKINKLVDQGVPFRDAYKQIKNSLKGRHDAL